MKIIITSPVQHDGKPLEVGETVSLPDRTAKGLIDAGAAELAGKTKADPPVEGKQPASQSAAETAPSDDIADEQDRQQ